MKHEKKHYQINVVLLSAKNALTSCCKKEGVTLYKLWVAAKKDELRKVLDEAFIDDETYGRDVFEFCGVETVGVKVKRLLREVGYENSEDYVTFEVISWGQPFACPAIDDDFSQLVFQEFTLGCDISYTTTPAKDEDGHLKYNAKGQVMKTDAGCFNASDYFNVSNFDVAVETFDE